jgi:hypothetical protein
MYMVCMTPAIVGADYLFIGFLFIVLYVQCSMSMSILSASTSVKEIIEKSCRFHFYLPSMFIRFVNRWPQHMPTNWNY